ncbi:MAG: hypothetical protein KJ070_06885, partial [Verrucomicrobia bacterium]|nr:hypothetical protein [Verrucomicrobiota bacterium]
MDIAGGYSNKVGFAAVGISPNDYWNSYNNPLVVVASMTNLKWSNTNTSSAGMVVRNAPGQWGNTLPDAMFQGYNYAHNQGNVPLTFTHLPNGICDVYLYGHTTTTNDNALFDLWSEGLLWGFKGTSLAGYGPTSNKWENGQHDVVFKDVTVSSNQPVVIQAKHTTYHFNNLSGLQLAYKANADTDADGLPDGWEMKWFASLSQAASADPDSDGLPNWREYQVGFEPMRSDSDGDGVLDCYESESAWVEDAVPQGAFTYATSESWNWVSSFNDGVGWNGGTVTPRSGGKMHLSANVTNALHQHYFEKALATFLVNTGDVLYAYVNLDPVKLPSEVMLQFCVLEDNGSYSWEHRAYWGANLINSGTDGTLSRTNLGVLPASNAWVRLEVPASRVGLEGKMIEGLGFTLYSGRAAWDGAGKFVADMDGDALPDSWEIQHFGNIAETPSGDFDMDGINNGTEYTNGTDPNTIDFTIAVTNQFTRASNVPLVISVLRGTASSMAVLVNSTNFPSASWSGYTSNRTADVGANEGWHQVWAGLRGRLATSQQTWKRKRVKLDSTSPLLVITKPSSSVVAVPIVQLKGYSPEPLAVFSCDLTNALGLDSNRLALLLKRRFNTNTWEFTTNYFQCFDVPLTNGLNTITLRATDWAGNVTVTNASFTLDYSSKTNPPVIKPDWPRTGTRISGGSFTARGWVNDPTASVKAEIVGGGGTNLVNGRVGRDGDFWIENVPLAVGTNLLKLTATDVVSNSVTTNLSVTKSDLTLTIASTALGGSSSGGIGDTNYAVWINGVRATNQANNTWTAAYAGLNLGQSAVQVRAIPNTDNGGNGSGASAAEDQGNPSSAQAVDAETELVWPAGQIYANPLHLADDYATWETNGEASMLWHYEIGWDESTGGSDFEQWGAWPISTNIARHVWEPGSYPHAEGIEEVAWYSQGAFWTNEVAGWPQPNHYYFGELEYDAYGGLLTAHYRDEMQLIMLTGGGAGSTGIELYGIAGAGT